MNVIVSNKQKSILDNANIDVYKELTGLFNVEDLINNFKNYFFTKMIIDATSIVEFANPRVLKQLAEGVGSEKLIILLPSKPTPPRNFIEMLISLGIYNFSSNINDIVKFIERPNSYDDVNKNFDNEIRHPIVVSNDVKDNPNEVFENNEYKQNVNNYIKDYLSSGNDKYVLGIKNVTRHAGTTTFIYMIKKMLEYRFNKRVLALETTNDFIYFKSQNMYNVSDENLEKLLKNNEFDICLIDLNNNNYESICNDILYLIEPSIISLNRLISENNKVFDSLKNKKIVLNKCLITKNDVNKFSQESGLSFYFVVPTLNERVGNSIIEALINKLGL